MLPFTQMANGDGSSEAGKPTYAGFFGATARRFDLGVLRAFGPRRHRNQSDLIAALNDVASAVSSTIALDTVLDTIVERAKRITNTDKAALVLTHDHSESLDNDTLVVKGSRDEHPQEWWESRLQPIATRVFETGQVYLEFDRGNDAWFLGAPVRVKDHPVGLLCAINSSDHAFNQDQMDFLAVLGAFAATVIENARLAEQTKYVLLASERDRIAREMHDGISQSLFSVALGMEVCRKQVMRDPSGVAERLDELQQMIDVSRSELRRFIYDLRPIKLQELGLAGAIEYWIHEVTTGKQVKGSIAVTGTPHPLRPSTEACLYRVAKESVSNIVKHADATEFTVTIEYVGTDMVLTILDNGHGFDVDGVEPENELQGLGLRSIRERVSREGGVLSIASVRDEGTRIEVRVCS